MLLLPLPLLLPSLFRPAVVGLKLTARILISFSGLIGRTLLVTVSLIDNWMVAYELVIFIQLIVLYNQTPIRSPLIGRPTMRMTLNPIRHLALSINPRPHVSVPALRASRSSGSQILAPPAGGALRRNMIRRSTRHQLSARKPVFVK
jgi:hypothetical protein